MVVNNKIIYVYVFASARPVDGVGGIMFCCCLSICACVHICVVIFVHTIYTQVANDRNFFFASFSVFRM